MGCGCQDKDVQAIAETSAKRNGQFVGLPDAINGLVLVYKEHNKLAKLIGQLGSAKVKDFENPTVLANAKFVANKYSSLLQRLSYLTSKIIAESYAEKVEIAKRLNELQQAAPQALGKSKNTKVKKGK